MPEPVCPMGMPLPLTVTSTRTLCETMHAEPAARPNPLPPHSHHPSHLRLFTCLTTDTRCCHCIPGLPTSSSRRTSRRIAQLALTVQPTTLPQPLFTLLSSLHGGCWGCCRLLIALYLDTRACTCGHILGHARLPRLTSAPLPRTLQHRDMCNHHAVVSLLRTARHARRASGASCALTLRWVGRLRRTLQGSPFTQSAQIVACVKKRLFVFGCFSVTVSVSPIGRSLTSSAGRPRGCPAARGG